MEVRQFNKVLIVEDDLELLENLKEIFASYFSVVVGAPDGASAYLALRDEEFDLILTDLCMAGFSGIELVTRLRAEGNFVPVILMSGVAKQGDLIRALKLGVRDFVQKPYKIESLIEATYNVIEVHKREKSIHSLLRTHDVKHEQVRHEKKMMGLLQAAQVAKKVA